MVNADSHIYLYAKNHYEQSGDLWEDLRIIIAHRNMMDLDKIDKKDILYVVSGVAAKHIGSVPVFLDGMINDMFPILRSEQKDTEASSILLRNLLRVLLLVEVYDGYGNAIIRLDNPDPNILPLKKGIKLNV